MTTDCIDTKIEKALNDKNITKIMNRASSSFSKQLDSDIIYTCQINALWKAFLNFNPDKKTKFTTYLYKGVYIECIKEVKFMKKNSNYHTKKLHNNIPVNSDDCFFVDLMDELDSEEDREIIMDKLSNMTIDEMSKKRNQNRETTRKKLKTVLSKLENSFLNVY